MLSVCEDFPVESVERRHGSAAAELEQLSQATVAILQRLSALNVLFPAEVPETWATAMEQLQSIRWPDRVSGLQCISLLAVLLENRPLQRRGQACVDRNGFWCVMFVWVVFGRICCLHRIYVGRKVGGSWWITGIAQILWM